MILVLAVQVKNINIAMGKDYKAMKKFALLIFIIALAFCAKAHAENLMDNSSLKVAPLDNLDMSGIPVAGTRNANTSALPDYDISRMIKVNPDFVTYPEANGIIWQKYINASYSKNGGTEITRFYIILGRKGLDSRWLNWNIPKPKNGSIKILRACIHDGFTGNKIRDIEPKINNEKNFTSVNFDNTPDKFILVLAWQEKLDGELSLDGLFWVQEDLRVWEAVVEIISSEKVTYATFPQENLTPIIQDYGHEKIYAWRGINIEPVTDDTLARLPRAGIAVSSRKGENGMSALIHEIENINAVKIPNEAARIFRENKNNNGVKNFLEWLKNEPEIFLADSNSRRDIPNEAPYTKLEKMLLARAWLKELKINASLKWVLPYTIDERSPLCSGIFYKPVLELKGVKNLRYYDFYDVKSLPGLKLYEVNDSGKLITKKIPAVKPGVNRLSANLDLNLDQNGLLNGDVKIILRGAWKNLITGTPEEMLLKLFPGLSNYRNVKLNNESENPELNFEIYNKPGVAGAGQGILAIMPCFEPDVLRKLAETPPTIELKFTFIIEQNINLALPKGYNQALVSGSIPRGADKINYSESYVNRRHRLLAESRLEINMPSISLGNMNLLRRNLSQWHTFAARNIPVR